MRIECATAPARIGLLGNPSDGYGGKAIALAIEDFDARVELREHHRLKILPGHSDLIAFEDLHAATAAFATSGCDDGLRLLRSALLVFVRHFALEGLRLEGDPRGRFTIGYRTSVPRQVGLSGSSAVVVAALRALCSWFERKIAPAELAELALEAEVSELGIAAGPMDRVIQAHGGVMAMDLREPRTEASYRRLQHHLVPPLYLAWDPSGGRSSARVHSTLRARFEAGDPQVLAAIDRYREIVDEGVTCLEQGQHDRLRALMDENFDLRVRIFAVSDRDREIAALARRHGASAKLTGSGGALVGIPADPDEIDALASAIEDAGYRFMRPHPAPCWHPEGESSP